MPPLLTLPLHIALIAARDAGRGRVDASVDLGRSVQSIEIGPDQWRVGGASYPYLERCRERTIYHWDGASFEPVARFGTSLLKLVPTDWGPPTFEIDGIKMLPTAQVSPFDDAARKVALVEPRGKVVLDTCAGLGYFAHWCLDGGAQRVVSYEKNPDVLWLRALNPWSPDPQDARLDLRSGDVAERIRDHGDASADAILHDPPRFGIAGELYSQAFYDQLARVLRPSGRLFHYTGTPNKLTSGRDVPREVSRRLQAAGFVTELVGDGVLARRSGRKGRS
ncbi:MAG TPA: MnmC family methyltransferase [Nevskiaceae bacterium]|nr:MnmC family methyltransferase [Nevskiaceae bacterium]